MHLARAGLTGVSTSATSLRQESDSGVREASAGTDPTDGFAGLRAGRISSSSEPNPPRTDFSDLFAEKSTLGGGRGGGSAGGFGAGRPAGGFGGTGSDSWLGVGGYSL